jgi:hypothetical protein
VTGNSQNPALLAGVCAIKPCTFGDCKNTAQGINQIVVVDFQGGKRTLSYDLTLIAERLGVVAATEISVADEVAT